LKTSDYQYYKCPHDYFNVVQKSVAPHFTTDTNVVISFNTATGKTLIAECMIAYHLSIKKDSKIVYVSPYKSISVEKYNSWTENDQFKDYGVLLSNSDTNPEAKEWDENRILILTNESLDSKTRSSDAPDWLSKVSIIVVDEVHLIGQEGRGGKLESMLMRFSRINPDARIVCLSATFENSNSLAKWIKSLNNKPTKLFFSDWSSNETVISYHSFNDDGYYKETNEEKIKCSLKLINARNFSDKTIVFVHSKKTGLEIQNRLSAMGTSCHFHNASAGSIKQKQKIIDVFNDRYSGLNVLISTSTLSSGVNLSCDRAIIVDTQRAGKDIPEVEIHQMCGRVGRVQSDDINYVDILIKESIFENEENRIRDSKNKIIISQIAELDELCFHVLAEISTGQIIRKKDINLWFERSFNHHQGGIIDADEVINRLKELECVICNGGIIALTELGKISARLYFTPLEVFEWKENFDFIYNDSYYDDCAIAWALGATTSQRISIDLGKKRYLATSFRDEIAHMPIEPEGNVISGVLWWWNLGGTIEGDDGKYPISLGSGKREAMIFKENYSRMHEAFMLMNSNVCPYWKLDNFFEDLRIRIIYRVEWELVDLCKIVGIGKTIALSLYNNEVTNEKDLISFMKENQVTTGSWKNKINKIQSVMREMIDG